MAFLLALETSSTICSVALFKDGEMLGISELQIEKSHSSHITVLINQLLQNCRVVLNEVAVIALSDGPGSYTGLRIGSSTAKGLCYALDIPLVTVSTLKALAYEGIKHTPNPEKYLFCPMIDARRMEVYTCLVNHHLEEIEPIAPVVLENNTFVQHYQNKQVLFLGSGATKMQVAEEYLNQVLFLTKKKPTACAVGELGWQKFLDSEFEDVAYYEPFYLKEVYITSSKK